jgi:hypothetical protein
MAHDPDSTWFFWVKCRKCGAKALAFRDHSRGRLRNVGSAEYAITCGNCSHADFYTTADLRSGPASSLGTKPGAT